LSLTTGGREHSNFSPIGISQHAVDLLRERYPELALQASDGIFGTERSLDNVIGKQPQVSSLDLTVLLAAGGPRIRDWIINGALGACGSPDHQVTIWENSEKDPRVWRDS
jgi:hypothetical protein